MSGTALALLAAGAVVVARGRPRRPPQRARALAALQGLPPDAVAGHAWTALAALDALGAWVLGAARSAAAAVTGGSAATHRWLEPTPERLRRAGTAVAASAAALVLAPPLALPAAVASLALPALRSRRAAQARAEAIAAEMPDVVDLLGLAVGAGLTVPLALAAVARRCRGPLAAELRAVLAEAAAGERLADALDGLPARAGPATASLAASLASSERYGTALTAALDRLADDVRRQRRQAAEARARTIPVKLLFPLVCCTLPAFALLTVAPLVVGALGSLRS